MNNHVDNVFKMVMDDVETDIIGFANHADMVIEEYSYDLDSVYIKYNMIPGGKAEQAAEKFLDRQLRKLVADLRGVKHWGVALKYIQENNIAYYWDEIHIEDVVPAFNEQIKNNVRKTLNNMEGYIEDFIVEYEENSEEGEHSYFVSQSEVMNIVNDLKINVEIKNELYWTDDKILDKWEESQ